MCILSSSTRGARGPSRERVGGSVTTVMAHIGGARRGWRLRGEGRVDVKFDVDVEAADAEAEACGREAISEHMRAQVALQAAYNHIPFAIVLNC